MREILFRGKRTDNGEWVYGIPARFRKIDNVIRVTMIPEIDGEHVMSECACVDPDTVGQVTGLSDNEGNNIFEGDVISFCADIFDGDFATNSYVGSVLYEDGEFFIRATVENGKPISGRYFSIAETLVEDEEARVVGNIHDNPELLQITPPIG